MKALICERCGSNDLTKVNKEYVCSNCGTRYLIDNNINLQQNTLQLADEAFNEERYDSAYKYYTQLVEIDPDNFEYITRQGLSLWGKGNLQNGIPSICINRLNRAIEVLQETPDDSKKNDACLKFTDDIYQLVKRTCKEINEQITTLRGKYKKTRNFMEKSMDSKVSKSVAMENQARDKRIAEYNQKLQKKIRELNSVIDNVRSYDISICNKVISYADNNTQFVYYFNANRAKCIELYNSITIPKEELREMATNGLHYSVRTNKADEVEMLINMGADVNVKNNDNLTPIYWLTAYPCKEEEKKDKLKIFNLLIENGAILDGNMKYGTRTFINTETSREMIDILISKDPSLKDKITKVPKEGCYIATCVYGSYDSPEVLILRKYRDNYLSKSVIGKIFIKTYYIVSPILVRLLGNKRPFKSLFRGILDNFIIKLGDDFSQNG